MQLPRAWSPYQDRYAIIVMGGHVTGPPHYQWYWGDTYGTYRQLLDHGFAASDIYFLSYGDSATAHPEAVDAVSTTQGILAAYAWARDECDAEDLLYIYWVDHGSPTAFETYDGTIAHRDLGTLTGNVTARCVAGAYNPCYSGGVIDDLSRAGVFTTTSQDATHLNSYGWAGAWRTGLSGGSLEDPSDDDGDGTVSFSEAYLWVCPRSQAAGEHPMLDDNGDLTGHECSDAGFNLADPSADGYFGHHHSLDGWRSEVPANLIGWWPFDEGSGAIVHDRSGHALDGIHSGGRWVSGVWDSALDLRGMAIVHGISGAFDDPIDHAFTVAAYVRWDGPNEYGRDSYVFDGRSADAGLHFAIDREGIVCLRTVRSGGIVQGVIGVHSLVPGEWTHIAGTFDASAQIMRVYINGRLDAESPATASYFDSYLTAAMGTNRWGPTDGLWCPLNGALDEVRLYDAVLTEAELMDLTGLIAWWPFDEGSGNLVHDICGQGYHGNNVGGEWTEGVCGTVLRLSGTDIVSGIPDRFDDLIEDAFTVAASVRWDGPNEYGSDSYVFDGRSAYSGLHFAIDRAGAVCLRTVRSGGITQGVVGVRSLVPGEWTHIAGSFDASAQVMRVYVNGRLDAESPATAPYEDSYLTAAIGNNRWAPGDHVWCPLNGCVDNLRLYNLALPPDLVTSAAPDLLPASGDPAGFLAFCAPNPFVERTCLRFFLPIASPVRVELFRVDGSAVAVLRDGVLPAGWHTLRWDGREQEARFGASGVYFARLATGGEQRTLRICRIR